MPNIGSKQAYVQGFDCESTLFKKAVNMFEHMKIAESIYEYVVYPYDTKPTRAESNRFGHIMNTKREYAFSNTHPVTEGSTGKQQKRYVDRSKSKSKPVSSTSPGILLKNVSS